MTADGLAAARSLVEDAKALAAQLTDEQWRTPSAASGWTVQDVYTHMGYFFNTIADPTVHRPDNPSGRSEDFNDVTVKERAHWSPGRTHDYYLEQSTAALAALEKLQDPSMAEVTIRVGDLGTYPASMLADAVAFDHFLHLSSDILAPFGPVELPQPELTAQRARAALTWMLAGLPQMYPEALQGALTQPLGLVLTGEGGREVLLAPVDGAVVVEEMRQRPETVVTSTVADFLRWSTTRMNWRGHVTIDGDAAFAETVLGAIDIV